ncbi:MAG: hypothetical protein ACU841_05780, partial [Gammaproteobacteria bacterium]
DYAETSGGLGGMRSWPPGLIEFLHQNAPTWLHHIATGLTAEEIADFPLDMAQVDSAHMLREGAHFFEKLGRDSTYILILDDCHWSDKSTLDLLNFLAFRRSPAKLLMILSFRPGENSARSRQLRFMRNELHYRGMCRELTLPRQ